MSDNTADERYWDLLVKSQEHAIDSYDQMLFKLSGGALGLSFVFTRQFVGDDDGPRVIWALGIAWVLWIASLICTLASHYSSAKAFEKTIDKIPNTAVNEDHEEWRKYLQQEVRIVNKRTRCLNFCGGLAFVIGAALAGFFMICSLPGGN